MIMLTVGFIVLCYVIVYDCRLKSEYCQKTDSEAHEQFYVKGTRTCFKQMPVPLRP